MEPLHPLEIPPKFIKIKFKSKTSKFICYIIYCVKTGKWYFGSGASGRIWKHFSKSAHRNERLYSDFLEFGAESFKFWIYGCESKEDSLTQEQILIDSLPKVSSGAVCNPKYSYNMAINATGGNTYDANNPNDKRRAKPFEARNAITHELIASFSSLSDPTISDFFSEKYSTHSQLAPLLQDAPKRGAMLCFWNLGALIYLRYKNETLEELELRTKRCLASDVADKLRLRLKVTGKIPFIPEVTVTNGKETHHLKDYDSYSEAARRVGLEKKHWSLFGEMIQGKKKSCDGWRVVV